MKFSPSPKTPRQQSVGPGLAAAPCHRTSGSLRAMGGRLRQRPGEERPPTRVEVQGEGGQEGKGRGSFQGRHEES